MGAEVFHGRVRDGIGCIILAMTTGPPGRIRTTDEWWVGSGVCVLADGVSNARLGAARGVGLRETLAGAVLENSGALSGD